MRHFAIFGAVLAVSACGGVSTIGKGHDGLDGGSGAGGSSAAGGGAVGSGGHAGAGGKGESGGTAGSGGSPNAGGAGIAGGGGASGKGCTTADECAVPAICKVCSDGSSSCATAECVKGSCSTTFPLCPTDAGAGDLKWFPTCGPPLCRDPSTPTGAPLCSAAKGEQSGDPCTKAGDVCDPSTPCSGNLMCAKEDPKPTVGCPVSRAKYKEDILYLSHEERAKLADDLQSIPLVRYRYKSIPEREHLGFIIEDIEPSPSVDSEHDQVDLYGYTSMAVAALQEQHAELEALKREVKDLKAALGVSSRGSNRPRR